MKYPIQLQITNATYQHVTQESKQKCPIKRDHRISTECIQHMTLEEENALQYVAGFVIRAAKDKRNPQYTELSGTGHLLLQP